MKNKKLLYGILGIGAIAGFYFWNKNKMPKDLRSEKQKNCEKNGGSWNDVEKICNS
jgi:hypothetical protein